MNSVGKTRSLIWHVIFILVSCPVVNGVAQHSITDAGRLLNEGKVEEAQAICESRIHSQPDDSEAEDLLGRVFFRKREWDKALAHHERAVKLAPKNIDFCLGLAAVLGEKTREANFISAMYWGRRWKSTLESAFALNSNHIESIKRLAYYLLNAPAIGGGDKSRAQELARQLVNLNEKEGRLLLASIYEKSDNVAAAIVEYQTVLNLDPSNASCHNSLGYLHMGAKNYSDAERHFLRYIELAPGDPNAFDSLGDYYFEVGKKKEAIEQYLKAVALDSNFKPSREKLKKLQ